MMHSRKASNAKHLYMFSLASYFLSASHPLSLYSFQFSPITIHDGSQMHHLSFCALLSSCVFVCVFMSKQIVVYSLYPQRMLYSKMHFDMDSNSALLQSAFSWLLFQFFQFSFRSSFHLRNKKKEEKFHRFMCTRHAIPVYFARVGKFITIHFEQRQAYITTASLEHVLHHI